MIIASGWAKGLKLATPKGEMTRPTAARVRGAILNMLAPELEGRLFLDLFAGSGAMGIEAVSRGARGAVFVEQGKEALACLKKNVAELERRAKAQDLAAGPLAVLGRDVGGALPALGTYGPFDLVFADPPYKDARAWAERLAGPLAPLTSAGGLFVVESLTADEAALAALGAEGQPWEVVKQRAYGDTMVTMLTRR